MPLLRIDRLTVESCRKDPGALFLFGDNLVGTGKAGQAIIRDEPNSLGIPTKRAPSMKPSAFFADRLLEAKAVLDALCAVQEELRRGRKVYVPSAGLGTGMAKLPEKSPLIFAMLEGFITSMEEQWEL